MSNDDSIKKVYVLLGIFLMFLVLVFFTAVVGGTVLYWIWPHVMVEVFGLPSLTWWQAVLLTWVGGCLFNRFPEVKIEKKLKETL